MSYLYDKLPWLLKLFQYDQNLYPMVNDIDLLLFPKGKFTKSESKKLTQLLNSKLQKLFASAFDIEGFDAKTFNMLKDNIVISEPYEDRLLIRGAIKIPGKKPLPFFDMEYRAKSGFVSTGLDNRFRIQSKIDLIDDKRTILQKVNSSFMDKLLLFFKESKVNKVRTLLESVDLEGTKIKADLEALIQNDNEITSDDLILLDGYFKTMSL